MQISKKIPFDNPSVLLCVRILYVVSNLIIAGIYFYVQQKINAKNGAPPSPKPTLLRLLLTPTPTDMTVVKYVEPAPMGSGEEPKFVATTVKAYDLSKLKEAYKAQLMGVGMMGVMHIYFKYTNPLLIQSIIPLKGAFEGNLVKIHLLGQSATGDLARPWKAAAGMMGAMGGGEIKTDKKSVEAAERAGRGGVKDE
jgi:hypothetical protein